MTQERENVLFHVLYILPRKEKTSRFLVLNLGCCKYNARNDASIIDTSIRVMKNTITGVDVWIKVMKSSM
jgi:hypothetical protein